MITTLPNDNNNSAKALLLLFQKELYSYELLQFRIVSV